LEQLRALRLAAYGHIFFMSPQSSLSFFFGDVGVVI